MKTQPLSNGSFRCIPEDSRDGFKGPEAWLLEALNAYYSHRLGYVLSGSKVAVMEWLSARKWTGKARYFNSSPAPFLPPDHQCGDDGISLAQVKKLMREAK